MSDDSDDSVKHNKKVNKLFKDEENMGDVKIYLKDSRNVLRQHKIK